jgi:hypothetical protein
MKPRTQHGFALLIAAALGFAASAVRADEFTINLTGTVTSILAQNPFTWDSSVHLGGTMNASFTFNDNATASYNPSAGWTTYSSSSSFVGTISVGDYLWNYSSNITVESNSSGNQGYIISGGVSSNDVPPGFLPSTTSAIIEMISYTPILANTNLPIEQLPISDFSAASTLEMYGIYQSTFQADWIESNITGYTVTSDSTVPDSGATITMLGLAVAGLVGLRRRLQLGALVR